MRVCLCLFLLFISNPQYAQNASLSGIVIEEKTSLPVEGAAVTIQPGNKNTLTDERGRFFFKNADNTDQITISSIGHEIKSVLIDEFSRSGNSIIISSKPVQLKEVVFAAGVGRQYQAISKLDIKMRGINNSQEVLRIVPGLFIGQHQGGGKAEQIFLRGFDCDHGTDVALFVDGMPINMVSHAHGQGYADAHFIIPETIEQVDFKKGPYYAEKGNFNTAGFVDFKTMKTLPNNMIKLEGGMFNTARVLGMFNLLGKKINSRQSSWYVASEYNYSDSYFDNPQYFNRFNLFTRYTGKISANNFLSLSASVLKSKWNASGQIPDRAVEQGIIGFYGAIDPKEGGKTSRININAQLTTTLRNENLVKNQIYYTHYNFDLHTNFTFFLMDTANGDQIRQKETRNIIGYNGSYQHAGYAGNTKITSELGINMRVDKTGNSELSNTINRFTVINPIKLGDIRELNAAIYLNETLRLNEKWTVNTGLRVDRFYNQYNNKLASDSTLNGVGIYKARADIVSPKLSINYQADKNTQFYFNTGRGFHSNDTRAVVVTNGRQILPPAYGADLGTLFKPSKNLLLHVAAWYLWLAQEFVYSGDGGIVELSGKTKRVGLDFSARYEPARSLYIDMDLNYAHGRSVADPKGRNYIPLAPVWSSTGGITYKNKDGLNGGLRYRYLSDRPAIENKSIIATGYFITDAVLSYTKPGYEIGVRANNLFNTKWKETQFATETRLKNEANGITEICFTPGTKFLAVLSFSYFFK